MLPFRDCLKRFEREAETGLWAGPRYRCRYYVWGRGAPLVLIHGLTDHPRSFAPLMAELAGSFRCLAYNLPDGLSDGARLNRYRAADFAADLLGVLDHLSWDRVFVLGSSFGSTVALQALLRARGRFQAAILQGGFAHRRLNLIESGLASLARNWPGRMRNLLGRPYWMERLDRPAFAGTPPEVYDFFVSCSGETPIRAACHRAGLLRQLDLRPRLAEIDLPVLLIGGDRDAIVPRYCEAALEQGLRHVRRVELSPCGHYPQYTHVSPMAAAIQDFAAEVGT